MNKKNFTDTILGVILIILLILGVTIFLGLIFLLPIAGGDTPSILDLIINLFK